MREGGEIVSLVTGRTMDEDRTPAARAIAQLRDRLGDASWFASLGLPPTAGEEAEVRLYLDALGLPSLVPAWCAGLTEAVAIVKRPDWDRAWGDAEQAAVAALTDSLARSMGDGAATDRLNRFMNAASDTVMGPAAVAAARAGLADQGLNRAMAGAATQAAYQMALVTGAAAEGAADPRTHPFALKYRLFAAGRWPLAAVDGRFHLA